jgi:signal transduction histidine kinase
MHAAEGPPPSGAWWSKPARGTIARIAALAAVYVLGGKLGLALALFNRSATPVWPPTGIALAAILILGPRVWPGVFIGAFIVNLTTAGTPFTSLAIALGNTLEALIGATLAMRFAQGGAFPSKAVDVFKFVTLAAVPSAGISATVGVTTLALGGLARWEHFPVVWLTWWLGDLVSAMVVAPLILIWATRPLPHWSHAKTAEALLALATTIAVGLLVFGDASPAGLRVYLRAFMSIPPLMWAAFRFGQRGALTAVLCLACIAGWGTLRGFGPLVQGGPNQSLLLVQMFVGTMGFIHLVLGAVATEYRQAEDALRASRAALRHQLAELETLYRNAPVGLCQIDADLRLVRINERLAGMNRGTVAGQRGLTVGEAMPGLAGALTPLLGRVLATGEPSVDQEIAGAAAASPDAVRHWMTSHYPVHDAGGGVVGVNVVVQDVTDSKRAEAELLAWHQELEARVERRTADLTRAYHALEKQMGESRRLEAQILRVAESEQVRLGSEIHDGLGQQLTGIGLLLAGLREKLPATSPALAEEAVRLQALVDESLRQAQGLARRLYPVELEGVGLLGALRRMARTTKRTFGANCVIRADGVPAERLDGPVAIQLFRISQEAVHNAIKHGGARHIGIDIARADGALTLTVTDDGAGLPADRDPSRGMGLRIMLYRARMMGGTLSIENGPKGGAILTCSIPAEGTPSALAAGAWAPMSRES